MTDLLEARDDLIRAKLTGSTEWLARAIAHILDHLEAQQTAASIQRGLDQAAAGETEALGSFAHYADLDPLGETSHADRVDRYGVRWVWCDACDGFRLAGHPRHMPGIGRTAATIDDRYGPLTFAPRPAEPPATAPQPAQAHGDAVDPARPAERHIAPETYDVRPAWLGDEAIEAAGLALHCDACTNDGHDGCDTSDWDREAEVALDAALAVLRAQIAAEIDSEAQAMASATHHLLGGSSEKNTAYRMGICDGLTGAARITRGEKP